MVRFRNPFLDDDDADEDDGALHDLDDPESGTITPQSRVYDNSAQEHSGWIEFSPIFLSTKQICMSEFS